jgi:diol dehydratase reactivase ATPase-like protein/cobalamin-dependent diol dehydratase reactivating factor
MTVIAGIDVGNATTEIVIVDDHVIVCAGRAPTRGRKGSRESLHGAAVLLRRLERQAGLAVAEARIAPLRPVDTFVRLVPDVPPATGRLRVLTAGVPTPGGAGACAGAPFPLGELAAPRQAPVTAPVNAGRAVVALVPEGLGYRAAAARVGDLLAAGTRVGAILVAGDEGVLIANRLPAGARGIPVIDQADIPAAASCSLLAVEVRPPGHPLTMVGDPVALGAAFGLGGQEAGDVARIARGLLDHSNAVVGLTAGGGTAGGGTAGGGTVVGGTAGSGTGGNGPAGNRLAGNPGSPGGDGAGPLVEAGGQLMTLRAAARQAASWAPGTARALRTADAATPLDDLFAVDLAEVAAAATARQGSVGRAILVAALNRQSPADRWAPGELPDLFSVPVSSPVSEPAAARLGAATTPGMAPGALVADIGSGTIDVTAPGAGAATGTEAVVAGAGDLLTAAVAQTLGVPRAAADWIKRGPCVRVEGTARYEAEDGTRGFLPAPAPASAAGMLAVPGPGGLLPFGPRSAPSGGHLGPSQWRAIRLRLKQAVLAASVRRALEAVIGTGHLAYSSGMPAQLLLVGGPAGDDELVGVLARSLPEELAIGRGNVGAALGGEPLGHRYAVALGLALAPCP